MECNSSSDQTTLPTRQKRDMLDQTTMESTQMESTQMESTQNRQEETTLESTHNARHLRDQTTGKSTDKSDTTVPRLKRDLIELEDLVIHEDYIPVQSVPTQSCRYTKEEFTLAIQTVQEKFNLSVTGVLDEATLDVMSQRRCGNSDRKKNEIVAKTPLLELLSQNHTVSRRVRRYAEEILKKDERERVRVQEQQQMMIREREEQERLEEEEIYLMNSRDGFSLTEGSPIHPLKLQSMGKVSSTTTAKPTYKPTTNTPSKLLKILTTVYARKAVEAIEVRQLILHEIMQEISDQKYEPKSTGTNNPHAQRQLRQRLKRSTILDEEMTTPISVEENLPVFTTDEGCIRYRLLSDSYSTRLSLIQQRSVLLLAFRMWSEVCPLCFVEDMDSNIKDVDIQLQFGIGKCPFFSSRIISYSETFQTVTYITMHVVSRKYFFRF